MLRFFFHRDSWCVRSLEIGATVACVMYVLRGDWLTWSLAGQIAGALCALQFMWLKFCSLYKWSERSTHVPATEKTIGIEKHFAQTQTAVSYIFALSISLIYAEVTPHFLWVTNIFFGLLNYIGGTLLIYRARDTANTLPINYFSHGGQRSPRQDAPSRKSA